MLYTYDDRGRAERGARRRNDEDVDGIEDNSHQWQILQGDRALGAAAGVEEGLTILSSAADLVGNDRWMFEIPLKEIDKFRRLVSGSVTKAGLASATGFPCYCNHGLCPGHP